MLDRCTHIAFAVVIFTQNPALADIKKPSDLSDFSRGIQDGIRCTPVKDSLDLVECINSLRDRGRLAAKDGLVYDAGIFFTTWRLEDAVLLSIQQLPVTPRSTSALKVSRDMTVGAFVGAQQAFRKIGFSDEEGLNAAGFHDGLSRDRWAYWSTQPVPSWAAPVK